MDSKKSKFRHSLYLLFSIISCSSVRLQRWVSHLFRIWRYGDKLQVTDILFWPLEWIVLTLDIFGLPEFYEIIQLAFKRNIRFLTSDEKRIGINLFGDQLEWSRIKLDDRACIGAKSGGFAYVSFYMINYWGRMYESTFVHELIHIWQFEKFGSPYIIRALRAQFSEAKYDYGGLQNLQGHVAKGGKFSELNYEQQGDIISDYFQIKTGRLKLRGLGKLDTMAVYESLLVEIGIQQDTPRA